MRLIDADKLYIPSEEMNAKMTIMYAPTVEAMPIVRCKNCKYYDEQTFMGHSMGWASCSGRFANVNDNGMRFKNSQ